MLQEEMQYAVPDSRGPDCFPDRCSLLSFLSTIGSTISNRASLVPLRNLLGNIGYSTKPFLSMID